MSPSSGPDGDSRAWDALRWAVATAAGLDSALEPPAEPVGDHLCAETMRLARRHEVVTLAALGLGAVGSSLVDALELARNRSMAKALTQAADAREVLHALADQRVDCLVLKGLPLSAQAFGAPHLRDAGDVDLLVGARHRARAESTLERIGYRRVPHPEVPESGFPHRRDPVQSGFAYRGADRATLVDLQWRLAATDRLAGLTSEAALEGSVPIDVAGVGARTLPPDEHYLFVVAHAAKHRFARLKWLTDIAALARHVDRELVDAEAARRGHTRMHDVAHFLVEEILLGRTGSTSYPRLTAAAAAALAANERIAAEATVDRERYLVGLYTGVRPRAHAAAWRARRGLHSLRWSA